MKFWEWLTKGRSGRTAALREERDRQAVAYFERNSRSVDGAPWLRVRSDMDVIITDSTGRRRILPAEPKR